MTKLDEFESAQALVKQLRTPLAVAELLQLYSLFKQGTLGNVQGERPGLLNPRGRAKYDAWASKTGLSLNEARDAYIDLVASLVQKYD